MDKTLDILYNELNEKYTNSNLYKDINLITKSYLNNYTLINIIVDDITIEDLIANYDDTISPTITCGLIVYNGQRSINKCLQLINGEFDEIVILNSVSTDKTVEIVNQNFPNVKIESTTIKDDFACARNLILKNVTTDWIYFIDADNYYDPSNKGKAKRITKLIDFLKIKCVLSIPIIEYDNSITIDNRRMFSMKENLYYYGAVHEEPFYSNLEDGYIPFAIAADIFINHDGYDPNIINMDKKNKRNIAITKQMHIEEPWNPKWMFFLGREMFKAKEDIISVITVLETGLSMYPTSKYKRYEVDILMLLCYITSLCGFADKSKMYQNELDTKYPFLKKR